MARITRQAMMMASDMIIFLKNEVGIFFIILKLFLEIKITLCFFRTFENYIKKSSFMMMKTTFAQRSKFLLNRQQSKFSLFKKRQM